MKASVTENRKVTFMSSKIRKVFLLVAGEAAIVIMIGAIFRLMMGPDIIAGIYIDGWSGLSIIGMTFAVLAVAGLLRDFGRAFGYCVADASDIAHMQVKKAADAVKLSMVTAVLTGVLIAIYRVIGLLYSPVVAEPEFMPLFLADMIIGILYGIVVVILLLPIYGRLKKQINRDGR